MSEAAHRRTHASTAARRRQIVRAALECFVESGVEATSLRQIAARAGITHVGLLHHFPSKDALVLAVLRERDQEDEARASRGYDASRTDSGRSPQLSRIMRDHQEAPDSLRLWMELLTSASRPDHPAHEYFDERYANARAIFAALLRRRVDEGATWSTVDAELAAVLVVAVMDGLQLQWLLDRGVPVTDALEHFLSLLLRPGKTLSTAPVTDEVDTDEVDTTTEESAR